MLKIPIITQTPDYIVINKPAGISVHKSGQRRVESDQSQQTEYTVADWVLENFSQTREVGEPLQISTGETIPRHGIVHRIDKDTSGALLIALTQASYEYFKDQFKSRTIKKTYRAFLYGNMKDDHVTVSEPLGKHTKDFRKRSTARNARGALKSATTFFHVLERAQVDGQYILFIEAQPKTGRTHQIRVHAKHLQHPIIADPLYASRKEKLLGFERLALHAYSLAFTDMAGFSQKVVAEFPEDFARAIALIESQA